MEELTDYSGRLIPDMKFELFSKDVLVRLLKNLNRHYLGIDGLWFQRVIREMGVDTAVSWSTDNWVKQCALEMKNVRKLLNITGTDVEALFKGLQFCPSFPISILEWEMKLETKNLGYFNVMRCPAVDIFEQWGKQGEEILSKVCKMLEPKAISAFASVVNPKIEVKDIKTPPRKSKKEICCQFEFRLAT